MLTMNLGVIAVIFALLVSSALAGDNEFGNVDFRTSCDEAIAGEINTAVAVLHSFWYTRAHSLFTALLESHPECAMLYWGAAMAQWTPLWGTPSAAAYASGRALLAAAADHLAQATPREHGFVNAASAFFLPENATYAERVTNYYLKMKDLYESDQDVETRVWFAHAVLAYNMVDSDAAQHNAVWPNYLRSRNAGKILEQVLIYTPMHPGALHYTIHLYDKPELCALGLVAAQRYAASAPSVPHALHMPSHIFTRLGLWAASYETNVASIDAIARVDPERGDVYGGDKAHDVDFIGYALSQSLQYPLMKMYIAGVDKANLVDTTSAHDLLWARGRYFLETESWDAASKFELLPAHVPWDDLAYSAVHQLYVQSVGLFYLRRRAAMPALEAKMAAAFARWEAHPSHSQYLPGFQRYTAALAQGPHLFALFLAGKHREALKFAQELRDQELYQIMPEVPMMLYADHRADMLIALDRCGDALKEYNLSLTRYPNRFHALFRSARCAKRLGDEALASSLYAAVAALCPRGAVCARALELAEAREGAARDGDWLVIGPHARAQDWLIAIAAFLLFGVLTAAAGFALGRQKGRNEMDLYDSLRI